MDIQTIAMKYSRVHYWWLFTILWKYSTCIPSEEGDLTEVLMNDASVDTSSSTPQPASPIQRTVSNIIFRALVYLDMYCENVYFTPEVEKLLDMDTSLLNWWFDESTPMRHLSNPTCSSLPTAGTTGNDERISDHEFFETRNIRIPKKRGKKGYRLTKFEHLNKSPLWKGMLECVCEVAPESDDGVCVDGKIVNLSRGVGGDRSFFVYAPNPSSTSYHVVAHVCFPN